MIWTDDDEHWRYATVDTDSNESLYIVTESIPTSALGEWFSGKFRPSIDRCDTVSLVENAPPLKDISRRHHLAFRDERNGDHTGIVRVSCEIQRRTDPFSDCFSHDDRGRPRVAQ
jgi:hypothetical protein